MIVKSVALGVGLDWIGLDGMDWLDTGLDSFLLFLFFFLGSFFYLVFFLLLLLLLLSESETRIVSISIYT